MSSVQVFEKLAEYRYEQLVFCHDKATGLRAIIAIHDTTLGPALGGCRMYPYMSEEDAIVDVLRLARGMTYKAAASGLNLGGGKSVIMGNPEDKSEELLRSFGRYIETLGGRYIVAEEVFGSPSLEGRTVAVQGLGNVGSNLCQLLHHREGSNLIVTDIDRRAVEVMVKTFGAKPVEPDEILFLPCDILAPCALGAVVNGISLPNFRCSIIAGSANNILLEARHGEALAERGILYAPDYVINAGGLINVADELEGYDQTRATKRVARIYDSVKKIIAIAKRDGVPTNIAADTLALERIDAISSIERLHTGHPYGLDRRRRETL
jgi:leucine dehydrogenase